MIPIEAAKLIAKTPYLIPTPTRISQYIQHWAPICTIIQTHNMRNCIFSNQQLNPVWKSYTPLETASLFFARTSSLVALAT